MLRTISTRILRSLILLYFKTRWIWSKEDRKTKYISELETDIDQKLVPLAARQSALIAELQAENMQLKDKNAKLSERINKEAVEATVRPN